MTTPIEITQTAVETITHANAELHGRKYLFTYKQINSAVPTTVDLAVHISTADGNYDCVGNGQLANGRLIFNIKEDIGSAAYAEITADALAVIDKIKQV